jgi:hypothetical protein
MEMGCFASKWWAFIDESIALGRQMDLTFIVRYDSGELFEPVERTLDFAWRVSDHGWNRAEPRELPIARKQDR